MSKKVNVFVRIKDNKVQTNWRVDLSKIYLTNQQGVTCFDGYDGVFYSEDNYNVYNNSIKPIILKFLSGENGTVFAYGQTGSGKTYTFLGKGEVEGSLVYCFKDILEQGSVNVSYLEIYNEKVYDLFTNRELQIYTVKNIPTVSRLSTSPITSLNTLYSFMDQCESNRKYGSTEYNLRSSRSHTIFQVKKNNTILNLIDLAGSERASKDEDRRREGAFINRSLLALCNLVTNLQENKFFGYRDSKLTRILQSSLDGKTNIVGLCMISPDPNCINESISTLKFAGRLTNLEIKVRVTKTDVKQEINKEVVKKNMKVKNQTEEKNLKNIKGFNSNDKRPIVKRIIKVNNQNEEKNLKNLKGFNTNDKRGKNEIINNKDPFKVLYEEDEGSILDSSDSIELFKHDKVVNFYNLNQNDVEINLLLNRIEDLEKMILDLLKKHPSKRFQEIFILERHMFQLKLKKIKGEDN